MTPSLIHILLLSIAEKLHKREQDISQLLAHIRAENPEALRAYDGSDVNFILEMLSNPSGLDNLTERIPDKDRDLNKNRKRRHGFRHSADSAHNRTGSITQHQISSFMQGQNSNDRGGDGLSGSSDSDHGTGGNSGDPRNIRGGKNGGDDRGAAAERAPAPAPAHSKHITRERGHEEYMQRDTVRLRRDKDRVGRNISQRDCPKCVNQEVFQKRQQHQYVGQEEHDTLREVAHGLHFASISLLGFLVIEVSASPL